jgi:hypothetical protein
MTVDELVKHFGKEHREVIIDAIKFLEEHEPLWKLNKPIDRIQYIRDVLQLEIRIKK